MKTEDKELLFGALCQYAPYEVKMIFEKSGDIRTLTGVSLLRDEIRYHFDVISRGSITWDYKPLLRPLSDLTKEIEVNGERFVPFFELAKIELGEVDSNKLSDKIEVNDLSLEIELLESWFTLYFNKSTCQFTRWDDGEGMTSCKNDLLFKLFEWHFDVFGLIEKGLAIDINTLKD